MWWVLWGATVCRDDCTLLLSYPELEFLVWASEPSTLWCVCEWKCMCVHTSAHGMYKCTYGVQVGNDRAVTDVCIRPLNSLALIHIYHTPTLRFLHVHTPRFPILTSTSTGSKKVSSNVYICLPLWPMPSALKVISASEILKSGSYTHTNRIAA